VFKNLMVDAGMIDDLWTDLQQQLDARGLKIRRGVIQDATFITADPGHATADTPRSDQARTRRCRDGTWAKKGTGSQFGYKPHTLLDREFQLIRRLATTTASLHDSRIDLSKQGETVYRDKRYLRSVSNRRRRWIKRCIGRFGTIRSPSGRNDETGRSAVHGPS
jgi:IS5 family transposase